MNAGEAIFGVILFLAITGAISYWVINHNKTSPTSNQLTYAPGKCYRGFGHVSKVHSEVKTELTTFYKYNYIGYSLTDAMIGDQYYKASAHHMNEFYYEEVDCKEYDIVRQRLKIKTLSDKVEKLESLHKVKQ